MIIVDTVGYVIGFAYLSLMIVLTYKAGYRTTGGKKRAALGYSAILLALLGLGAGFIFGVNLAALALAHWGITLAGLIAYPIIGVLYTFVRAEIDGRFIGWTGGRLIKERLAAEEDLTEERAQEIVDNLLDELFSQSIDAYLEETFTWRVAMWPLDLIGITLVRGLEIIVNAIPALLDSFWNLVTGQWDNLKGIMKMVFVTIPRKIGSGISKSVGVLRDYVRDFAAARSRSIQEQARKSMLKRAEEARNKRNKKS